MINNNNRPSIVSPVGSLTADVTKVLLYVHKKMRIHAVALIQETAIAADGSNYFDFVLKKNNTAIGTAVSNKLGIAARTALELDVNGSFLMEAGDVLSVFADETGTVTTVVDAIAVIDAEVIGQ